ncbi:MAG TPA: M3 family metallopeptidase [Xanthobacteraceae bacterium]|nr:M3 family metallopeptidase [Xanthobacteraceae bacterium]
MSSPQPTPTNDRTDPLLGAWTSPHETPPFAAIRPEHFRPAFDRAMADHRAEIEVIANCSDCPSFANTIVALERSGQALDRVSDVFDMLAGAHTNDALMEIEREMSPLLAAHHNRIHLHDGLYARIKTLWDRRAELGLTPEQARVLERYDVTFRRAGAGLPAVAKSRMAEICERLAVLGTAFSQNVLADEQAYVLVLDGEEDLAGLSDGARAAARAAAAERGMPGKHVITLARSSVEPFLQSSARRDLREKAYGAWTARGNGDGATDNKTIIAEMIALRAERARLLGYPTFAHYRLDDAMAKTPQAVQALLDRVWPPARVRAMADRDALQELIQREGGNFDLAAWDWRYYAQKLRKVRCDIDAAEIAPYLVLDNMVAAAFDTAHRLFGLTFRELYDVSVWHADVRVWEVSGPTGQFLGVFFGDYFARSSKRSGAWMTTLRTQHKLDGDVRPLVINVMNFAKASQGEPTLLSLDDARTLFHEFGHALHGLMSDVTFPMIAGTRVATDFVELPSQLYEHWLEEPDVLRRFARHHQTGEPMPEDLVRRLIAARAFDQGFATVEYMASALVDLAFHQAPEPDRIDPAAFEADILGKIGMPAEIGMRHRSPHFLHVFASDGYAAAYYSYMWSEVLDADAFEAFRETGNVFDPVTAARLRDDILAAGGTRDPGEAYQAFRGRPPSADALLRKRGFAEAAGGPK